MKNQKQLLHSPALAKVSRTFTMRNNVTKNDNTIAIRSFSEGWQHPAPSTQHPV